MFNFSLRNKMFNVTNYCEQVRGLPAENDFQLVLLNCTDISTYVRETCKCGAVVSLVISASSAVFNFDPTIAFTSTPIFGVSWLIGRTCAQKLEPQAQDMIKYFKEMKEGIYKVNEADAKRLGLKD